MEGFNGIVIELDKSSINQVKNEFNKVINDLNEVAKKNIVKIQVDSNTKNLNNEINNINNSFKNATNSSKSLGSSLSSCVGFISKMAIGMTGFYAIANKVRESIDYIATTDKIETHIQMITGRSREEVDKLTNSYKELAGQLSVTNKEMLEGSEEFLRAGMSDAETKKMLEVNTIASKVSQQTASDTSEQLIAIKNGYEMTTRQMEHVTDVISKIDNKSATSFKEISTALKYVSESASMAGTSFDNLANYIGVISAKTRQNSETIGQALKTVYSRYNAIKSNKVLDDEGENISKVEESLSRIGVKLRADKTHFKDFDTVLKDIASKYKNLDDLQRSSVVQSLGGTRQREYLMVLLEDLSKANEGTSKFINMQKELQNVDGNAKKMFNDAYLNSYEASVNRLQHSWETFYDKILNSKTLITVVNGIKEVIDFLTSLDLKTVATSIAFVGAVKGMITVFKAFKVAYAAETILETTTTLSKIMFTLTKGTTGLSGVLGALKLGMLGVVEAIGEMIGASLAFIATPIGFALTALAGVLALVTYNCYQNSKAQQEIKQKTDANKKSFEDLTQAMKDMNSEAIKSASQPLQKQEDSIKALIAQKKKLIEQQKTADNTSQTGAGSGISDYGRYQAQIDAINKTIENQIKVVEVDGNSVNRLTGEFSRLSEAQSIAANIDIANKIRQESNELVTNKDAVISLYREYGQLSGIENQNAQQKQRMSEIINFLKSKISELDAGYDANGNQIIKNTKLIDIIVQAMTKEGNTVANVTSVRLANAKQNASIEFANTRITYEQINNRIKMYRTEAQAIRTLMNTKAAQQQADGYEPSIDQKDAAWATRVMNDISQLEGLKATIDNAYSSIPDYKPTTMNSGGYTPSSSNTGKSGGNETKPTPDVANIDMTTDCYGNLETALNGVNYELERNKQLQDVATDKEKNDLIQKEIDLLLKKQNILNDKWKRKEKDKSEISSYLARKGIKFDADGTISNLEAITKSIQDKANALHGDAKKQAVEEAKVFQEKVKNYYSILGDINGVNQQWYQINNDMAKKKDEIFNNNLDNIDKENDAIQKQLDLEEQANKQWEASEKDKANGDPYKLKEIEAKARTKDLEILNGRLAANQKKYEEYSKVIATTTEEKEKLKTKTDELIKTMSDEATAIYNAENALKDSARNAIKEYIEKQKELDEALLESKHLRENNDLKLDTFAYSKEEFDRFKSDRINYLNSELSKVNDKLKLEKDNIYLLDEKKSLELEISNVQGIQKNIIEEMQETYKKIHQEKIDAIDRELKKLNEEDELGKEQEERQKRQNELIEDEIRIRKLANEEDIWNVGKDANGRWQSKWIADADSIDKEQKALDEKKKDNAKWEQELAKKKHKELLEEEKKYEQDLIKSKDEQYKIEKDKLDKKHEQEKRDLDQHYSDIDKMTDTWLKNLQDMYGTAWYKITQDINTRVASAMEQIKKLREKASKPIVISVTETHETKSGTVTSTTETNSKGEKHSEYTGESNRIKGGSGDSQSTTDGSLVKHDNLEHSKDVVKNNTSDNISKPVETFADFQVWWKHIEDKKKELQHFDTGGRINGSGIAMVHDKEIVLNANDTSKIMQTVQMVRNFGLDKINNIVNGVNPNNLNNVVSGIESKIKNFTGNMNSNQTIDSRSFNINKIELPNVRDGQEFADALMNLEMEFNIRK